jgi:hypothetical protein
VDTAILRKLVAGTISALLILGAVLSGAPAGVAAEANVAYANLAILHSDVARYNVWRPASWQVRVSTDARSMTTVVSPGLRDSKAYFVVVATDIGIDSAADRLERRIKGFDSLVHILANTKIEWQMQTYAGNVLAFDARYTYRPDGSDIEAERWVRQLYVGTWQYWLVAEASSPEEFAMLHSGLTMRCTRPQSRKTTESISSA